MSRVDQVSLNAQHAGAAESQAHSFNLSLHCRTDPWSCLTQGASDLDILAIGN